MTYYGIYKITNLLNGKMYIGQHTTDNIDDGYMGSGKIIKRAIKKYGVENFRKEWIMFCEDAEELNYWEAVFVDETWVMRSDTYNLKTGGNQLVKLSDEMKRHLKEINLGKHHSEETKRKLALIWKGRHHTESAKRKIGDAHRGEKNYLWGKHLSKETKIKMSQVRKGKHHSEDTKRKMRESKLGKHHSEQTKQKISQSRKGKLCGKNNPAFGKHWYNNGVINAYTVECPEGFVKGIIRKI